MFLNHFKPKQVVIAESYRFNTKQEEGESVCNVFVHLKHLSFTCKFGTFLKRASREKFVFGLNDEKIQEILLYEDMSLEKVFKIAQHMEMAIADVAHIKNKYTEENG